MLRATLRSFLAHKGRLLLSALAVVLSVAFVSGSLIFSDTVSRTFDQLFASTASDVSVQPQTEFDENNGMGSGRVPTVPAALLRRVAAVEGVADAHVDATVQNITVIDEHNKEIGAGGHAPTIATNWYPSDRSPVKLTEGHAPRGDAEALLDADTADRKNIHIGEGLRIIAGSGTFPVKVVGIATFTTTNPGAALVFLDTPTAQTKLLGAAEVATSIEVQAAPGITDTALKERIAAALDGGQAYRLRTGDEQAESDAAAFGAFLDIVKSVMLGFAGVAVLVGIFLIVNTFSMLIAQRTRELGLLRALGADRRQVRRSVLTEALLLGLVGSTLGLASGVGLAYGLIKLMGLLGMNLDSTDLVFGVTTPVVAYTVGLGVTFIAAYLPSRRAARVSPMAALSDADMSGTGRPLRIRAIAGLVTAVAGAAALLACTTSDTTSSAAGMLGLGVVLSLVAMVIAGPLLVRPVVRVLGGAFPKIFGPVGRLSQRNALRNPRRTGATASALMVGLALVAGMAVAGASMSQSFDDQIDKQLGADFVVQNRTFGPFPQEVTDRARKVEGLGVLVRERFVPMKLALPDGKTLRTTGGAFDEQGFEEVITLEYAAGDTAAALAPGHVALERKYADEHDITVGDQLPATFSTGRTTRLTVGALTNNESSGGFGTEGGFVLGLRTAEKYLPKGQDAALYINAAPDTDPEVLRKGLEQSLESQPQVKVRDQADYKKLIRDQIAVLLYLVYALLGLAIIIAVLGVVNTLALAVVERTREIGLLRAIGLSRAQTRRMIRLEAVVIAVFGAVLGLGLGLVWGVALQHVLALEGMKALAIPWGTVVTVLIGSIAVGLVAALLPALRASRMNVLAAISHQ